MGGFGKDPIPGFGGAPARPTYQDAGPLRLRVLNGPCAGREFTLSGVRSRIGRSDPPAVTVDIDLSECELGATAMVSRLHAELFRADGGVYLVDLGSRNGTWVDGRVVTIGDGCPTSEPVPISSGSRLRFANLEMELLGAEAAGP
jgi:pSer/pThr/pTyr-binding forkhead associated (FHA) protein